MRISDGSDGVIQLYMELWKKLKYILRREEVGLPRPSRPRFLLRGCPRPLLPPWLRATNALGRLAFVWRSAGSTSWIAGAARLIEGDSDSLRQASASRLMSRQGFAFGSWRGQPGGRDARELLVTPCTFIAEETNRLPAGWDSEIPGGVEIKSELQGAAVAAAADFEAEIAHPAA